MDRRVERGKFIVVQATRVPLVHSDELQWPVCSSLQIHDINAGRGAEATHFTFAPFSHHDLEHLIPDMLNDVHAERHRGAVLQDQSLTQRSKDAVIDTTHRDTINPRHSVAGMGQPMNQVAVG